MTCQTNLDRSAGKVFLYSCVFTRFFWHFCIGTALSALFDILSPLNSEAVAGLFLSRNFVSSRFIVFFVLDYVVYCEYCYKVTRHEKWIEILGDLLWCVALLTVTMQCNYATCHQRCIQEEIIFFAFFLQAINKGRKWLDSIIQRGVKYSYSYSIWIHDIQDWTKTEK